MSCRDYHQTAPMAYKLKKISNHCDLKDVFVVVFT